MLSGSWPLSSFFKNIALCGIEPTPWEPSICCTWGEANNRALPLTMTFALCTEKFATGAPATISFMNFFHECVSRLYTDFSAVGSATRVPIMP